MARSVTVCLLTLFVGLPGAASDCEKVANDCFADPNCIGTVRDNKIPLSNCVAVLNSPPGSPPHCTPTCRNLVLTFLNISHFMKMLYCNCSTAKDILLFGDLCEPFQSNALVKCNITITAETSTASPTGVSWLLCLVQ